MNRDGINYTETDSLEDTIATLDILYMTRVQKERFADADEYERLKDSYILTPEKMSLAGDGLRVLHPLPRVNEISVAVDKDPRACYFKQVKNGKYMRMALILKLLDEAENPEKSAEYSDYAGESAEGLVCPNSRCISRTEQELPAHFTVSEGKHRCAYCEAEAVRK